jgi:type I restriction enzyme M protein
VRTYHAFEESDESKIFKNTDFGYTTITVEQPLRLSWSVTSERIEAALATRAFEKLSAGERIQLENALEAEAARDASTTPDSVAFTKRIEQVVAGYGLTNNQLKNLVAGLAAYDDEAAFVRDAKGNLLADASLRDSENVPLDVPIELYASEQIEPHVPDFWFDRSKDKVGYEIPFTRHFYRYETSRSVEEIDADLNTLIAEITLLLAEIEK